jgi:hypothetical protein
MHGSEFEHRTFHLFILRKLILVTRLFFKKNIDFLIHFKKYSSIYAFKNVNNV